MIEMQIPPRGIGLLLHVAYINRSAPDAIFNTELMSASVCVGLLASFGLLITIILIIIIIISIVYYAKMAADRNMYIKYTKIQR